MLAVWERLYPNPRSALNWRTPFELLVATVLSAQCTDVRVNLITPRLFARYPDAAALAAAPVADVEALIRDCGLYHAKARHLVAAAARLVEAYGGQVPPRFEDLVTLPGVGRKTANVVLANAFGQDTLAVDTHVFRVSHRLGWSEARTPEATEEDLRRVLPRVYWSRAHHWMIRHGREICHARRPLCDRCPVAAWCPSAPTAARETAAATPAGGAGAAVALVSDLWFAERLRTLAGQAGTHLRCTDNVATFSAWLTAGGVPAALVDVTRLSPEITALLGTVPRVAGFGPHVAREAMDRARAAGITDLWAYSALERQGRRWLEALAQG